MTAEPEWKKVASRKVVRMHRPGWIGLWDHFVALVRKREQQTIPVPIEVSAYVKSKDPFQIQIETGESDDA
jgi:hypothetical protein